MWHNLCFPFLFPYTEIFLGSTSHSNIMENLETMQKARNKQVQVCTVYENNLSSSIPCEFTDKVLLGFE